MNTSPAILAGILATALPGLSSAAPSAPKDSPANVLFILVDDLGYKDTGFTGSDFYETPVIDSLSRLSVVFNTTYTGGANSAPSRACLMTGSYTPRHGVYAVFNTTRGPKEQMRLQAVPNTANLPLECPTMAEALTAGGYECGIAGKWHLGNQPPYAPGSRGFGNDKSDSSPSNKTFASVGDPKNIFSEVENTCEFMERSVREGKPFFAYLPFHAVHQSWQARPEYIEYFTRKKPGKLHNEVVYAAMIKHMDDAVGAVLHKLRELGVDENTLIVFTSDNGGVPETSQVPLRSFKGTFYEGGVRVPMFVRLPGNAPGSRDVPVINVDFFPTLLAWTGVAPAKGSILDGENLMPVIKGEAQRLDRESIFWHFPGYLDKPSPGSRDQVFRQRPSSMIRKGDWKLILFHEEWLLDGGRERLDTNHAVELYDLKNDVSEQRDMSLVNKAKRDELLSDLLLWIDSTDAPMPTPLNGKMAVGAHKAKKSPKE